MTRYIMIVMLVTGCSSLVSDPCQPGYDLVDGTCEMIAIVVPPPSIVPPPLPEPAPPQPTLPSCFAPQTDCDGVCTDLQSDPDNCGTCGDVCASGLCDAGVCIGATVGHVVAIGHDYQASEPAMDRVLADAVGLTTGAYTRIGYWRGTPRSKAHRRPRSPGSHRRRAPRAASRSSGWSAAELVEVDAVVIEPQVGDGDDAEADGAGAAQTLAKFVAAGHVGRGARNHGRRQLPVRRWCRLVLGRSARRLDRRDGHGRRPADAVAEGSHRPTSGAPPRSAIRAWQIRSSSTTRATPWSCI